MAHNFAQHTNAVGNGEYGTVFQVGTNYFPDLLIHLEVET
jgi:hypothetical protein